MTERFTFHVVPPSQPGKKLCAAVADGLRQPNKQLPCRFFYDAAGSELFERICDLPEYYPTRTERAILEGNADAIVTTAARFDRSRSEGPLSLVEFGSGSSVKTRLLIEAALRRQKHLSYVPIDISVDFLRASCLSLLDDYPELSVTGLAAEYNDAMHALPDDPQNSGPRLFLFLGSNIGNFEREEATAFLARLRACMRPHDRLLLGVDLVKDSSILEAAYNDAAGVTAQFNKNLLRRINRELDADFDLQGFLHQAPFVEEQARIEMHLISERPQTVHIDYLDLAFDFEEGEIVHTENSHKYTYDSMAALCGPAGLDIEAVWTDSRSWFAAMLLRPFSSASSASSLGDEGRTLYRTIAQAGAR